MFSDYDGHAAVRSQRLPGVCARPAGSGSISPWMGYLPLQAINLQSHDSDATACTDPRFCQPGRQQVISMAEGMGQAILAWLPPAAGTYTISARVWITGHESALASVTITISGMRLSHHHQPARPLSKNPPRSRQQAAATTSPQPPLPPARKYTPESGHLRRAPHDSEVSPGWKAAEGGYHRPDERQLLVPDPPPQSG